jgi:rare lipoprotein A
MKTHRPNSSLVSAASLRSGGFALPLGLALGLALAGCANIHTKTADSGPGSASGPQADAGKAVVPPYKGGGYYKDDGPGANPPANLDTIPDAVPIAEPFNRQTGKAYKVMGKRYVPLADNANYKAQGLASWYGRKFHGNATSIGEPYDMYAMTAAHPILPLPSYARVTNLENGKSVVVRVNDRGPFHPGRIIDLSYTAAHKLDILKDVARVEVAALLPDAAPTSFAALSEAEVSAPVAEERTPAVSIVSGRGIYLQLGAFGNPAAADSVMAQVTAKLSSNFPSVMRLEQNGLFKVQAGPFADAEAADQAAIALRNDIGLKAFKVSAAAPVPAPVPAAAPEAAPEAPVEAVTEAPAVNLVAAVASEPINPVVETPAGVTGLYLQLAAFSSPDAADALANRVKLRFGDELPGLDQINVDSLYKLQAGPFATPAAAERVASAYLQDFGVKPYRINR